MPSKKSGQRSSSSRPSSSKRGATRSGRTRSAGNGRPKTASGATKTLKKTAVKVMAGAAAGAVRAIIPPLEQTAGTSERAAGLQRGSTSKAASSGKQ